MIQVNAAELPWHVAVLAIPFLPRRYRWASVYFLAMGLAWHVAAKNRKLLITEYRSSGVPIGTYQVPKYLRSVLH